MEAFHDIFDRVNYADDDLFRLFGRLSLERQLLNLEHLNAMELEKHCNFDDPPRDPPDMKWYSDEMRGVAKNVMRAQAETFLRCGHRLGVASDVWRKVLPFASEVPIDRVFRDGPGGKLKFRLRGDDK